MSNRKEWLEGAILDYIKKEESRDLLDITTRMKLRVDITMESLQQLINQGLVIKQPRGISNVYIAAN